MGTTIAEVFARPPYLFSNSDLGLIWISPMIGSLIGSYFSGPLNDRLTLYLSTRNRGWREPEFRLWAFIPSAIIMPCGLVMYGSLCFSAGVTSNAYPRNGPDGGDPSSESLGRSS